jgi:hypothetical protein
MPKKRYDDETLRARALERRRPELYDTLDELRDS